MIADLFFATTLVFVYGTIGLLGYAISEQCCRNNKIAYNHPNVHTYVKMREVCKDIELFGRFKHT
jgi:hypothetical protein